METAGSAQKRRVSSGILSEIHGILLQEPLSWDIHMFCIGVKLARTNDMLGKNVFTKYVPSMKTTPFDSEFNSTSNDGTFIRRTSFAKIRFGL
ncbi:unnamed protein product [Adineta ricciae]|uniref:Uncharacterized protein n=1 Tax=Adineta ricciae TaxID=249248 RepID=A0A814HBV5_ADIRI|nr:unnamed protein product [Adineta ricciae]CAF1535205.1 unnamed protein product [Adineta ricciae]